MSPLARAWFAVTDLIWPRTCLVCDEPLDEPGEWCVCPACTSAITTDPHAVCPRCASTVGPHTDLSAGCHRCRGERYRFSTVTRLGVYDGSLRTAVLRAKMPSGDGLAEILGTLFARNCREQLLARGPQLVVPVPLHWTRWWDRRHNQAEGIARGLAWELGLPMARRLLRRVRGTPKQSTLTPADRRRNLVGAFRPRTGANVKGLRVLLVDDVLTTGATADAAAVAVRAAEAAQVHVAVLSHR